MKTRRRFPLLFLAAALLAFTAGCDGLLAPGLSGAPDVPEFDLTKPAEVVQAWASAFEERDLAAYDALIDAEFQFFPRSDDAVDFPWMVGDSWDRATEMGIVANMFDPDFSGEAPPISQMTFDVIVQTSWTNPAGHPWMTCNTAGQVLTGPTEGFVFDTSAEVELIQRGETYKVFAVHEIDAFSPGPRADDESVDEASFGAIKSLYR